MPDKARNRENTVMYEAAIMEYWMSPTTAHWRRHRVRLARSAAGSACREVFGR